MTVIIITLITYFIMTIIKIVSIVLFFFYYSSINNNINIKKFSVKQMEIDRQKIRFIKQIVLLFISIHKSTLFT